MQIAIIGGTRGLGKWIATFLKSRDFNVVITGRDQIIGERVSKKIGADYTNSNINAASEADVVIVSVPIDAMTSTIKEVAKVMKKGSLLMDVTSVKEEPAKAMKNYVRQGIEVLPTHPMFGPRIRSLDGQVVVLTPQEKGKWYNKVYNFLEKENARVLVTTPEMHDQMMSIVQGLTHFAYISIAATIERLQVDIKESRKFASPIYNLMVDMIARIVAQNPYLFYSIQTHNIYTKKTHETFISTYKDLMNLVSNQNESEFVSVMGSAAKHLDDLEAALGRSDKAISALNEEIILLKNSIGKEVGLRHIYSGKIHVGILKDISPDFVVLKENNKEVKVKLSNVEVLDDKELLKWKIDNSHKKSFDVSTIFPETCNPKIIANTINNLEDVINVEIIDLYHGNQIPSGKISITIRYEVINREARLNVENLLKGFGAEIR
ncbi:prephenate dehydrogenase [Methanobacterium oryzae]|uniref:prephenate dehydrogenase n=1 Tax=Methanobacterium oryzae TaxID=69540 RepID=UPI003D1E02D1